MSAQPEALRLAAELDAEIQRTVQLDMMHHNAAAELRRLHAENERLHQINQSHEMKLSVRGYEIQIADLEAQRDALLKALNAMLTHMGMDEDEWNKPTFDQARAAIKAVEEQK